MSNSFHDANHTRTLVAIESDGATIVNVEADPVTHALDVSNGTTGSDNGPRVGRHDNNHVPVLMATSSADGVTPIVVYADSSGNLLVDSM